MATESFERNIRKGSFTTDREDKWWLFPVIYAIVIIAFILYTLWALLLETQTYQYTADFGGIYFSPIYGFELPDSFVEMINWPKEVLTPAWLLIWAPIGFRATCYYERKVYYRAFFGMPPACSVDGVDFRRGKYTGERWFPFILNNFHRYFFYVTALLMIIQIFDFILPLQHGIGMGSIILFISTASLTLYVFSCHSFRHVIGGGANCYSCGSVNSFNYKAWSLVSALNKRHGTWFWISLVAVMVADFYIRLLNWGIFQDIIFINF